MCTPGYIYGKWSETAYKRRVSGEGETFRERKWAKVTCTLCELTVTVLSLKGHTEGDRPHHQGNTWTASQ